MDREQQQDRRQFLGASEVVAVDDCTQCVGWMHGGCVDPESGRGGYWDAAVERQIDINGKTALSEWEPRSDREANDMHNAAVAEIAAQLESDAGKKE